MQGITSFLSSLSKQELVKLLSTLAADVPEVADRLHIMAGDASKGDEQAHDELLQRVRAIAEGISRRELVDILNLGFSQELLLDFVQDEYSDLARDIRPNDSHGSIARELISYVECRADYDNLRARLLRALS